MADDGLLSCLNEAQHAGVVHEGSPLIVLAGPGTGKTRVITHRVAHLVQARDVDPSTIVAVTFTNKAADELRQRLTELVGPGVADLVHAYTFHGFGLRLLRRFPDLSGVGAMPEIIDSAQRRRLLRRLLGEHRVFGRLLAFGADALLEEAAQYLGLFRNAALSPADCDRFARAWGERLREGVDAAGEPLEPCALECQRQEHERFAAHARLYGLFEQACRDRGWLTIDELITAPAALLRDHERVRAICRHEYRHFVVDEFQDVNQAQIELLRQLAPPEANPDLVVVGDDDQAIYEFRGADDRAFARFAANWRNAQTLPLTENYRSEQPVLDLANAVISRAAERFAPDKRIERARALTERLPAGGAGVTLVELDDEGLAGDVIATMIREEAAREPEAPLSRLAVIARTHTDLDRVAAALEIEEIPLQRRQARGVAEDEGVQDLLAWVQLLVDPSASWAVRRVLWRPPISAPPERLGEWERAFARARRLAAVENGRDPDDYAAWLADYAPADAGVRRFLELRAGFAEVARRSKASEAVWAIATGADLAHADLLGGRERAARVDHLVRVVRFVRSIQHRLDPPGDLAAFWAYYNDLDAGEQCFGEMGERLVECDEQGDDPVRNAVQLLTAHGAKGLEFDVVFVPRVSPPHGYPKTAGGERLRLPEGLLDRLGDARTPKERERAEERRIFYVACTRAERRLVLLTRRTKSASRSEHFAQELAGEPRGLVGLADANAILAAGARDPLAREAPACFARELRRDAARAECRAARAAAAAALDLAERDGADRAAVDAAEVRIREAVERVAVAAEFERSGAAPPWVTGGAARETASRLRASVERERAEAAAPALRAMPSPLSLSFSLVDGYTRCAACFYVQHVLGLGDEPSAAISLGGVVHRVLESHAREWRDAEADGREPPGPDHLSELGRRLLAEELRAGAVADGVTADELAALLSHAREMMAASRAEILEIERRISVPYPIDGVEHTLVARLDRLDRTPEGVRIVDYKTGYASKARLEPSKKDLQLGIYAIAIRHEMPGVRGTAEYWLLRTGERGVIDLDAIDVDKVRAEIDKAARAMLAGEYPRAKGCDGPCVILGAT